VIEAHEELYTLLHTMASQINSFYDSFASLETFKVELTDVLKNLFINQNAIKQELFLIRNTQAEATSKKKPGPEITKNDENPKQTTQDHPTSSSSTPSRPTVTFASVTSNVPQAPKISKSAQPTKIILPSQKPADPKLLFIGDSISSNIDMSPVSYATKTKIVTTRAYSSVHDTVSNVAKTAARFRKSKFTEAGSVVITNLKTKENPAEHMEYFRQETVKSAQNISMLH
jgi:hypothetical protein